MKANVNHLPIIREYGNRLRENHVDKVAVMFIRFGRPVAKIYAREYFQSCLEKNIDRLVQVHDGIRLARFVMGSGAKNLPLLSLWNNSEMEFEIESAKGGESFEKSIAEHLHGEWVGAQYQSAYDVILKDGTRIECKGIGGAWHIEEIE